jgi:hypothetical protein
LNGAYSFGVISPAFSQDLPYVVERSPGKAQGTGSMSTGSRPAGLKAQFFGIPSRTAGRDTIIQWLKAQVCTFPHTHWSLFSSKREIFELASSQIIRHSVSQGFSFFKKSGIFEKIGYFLKNPQNKR